MNKIILALGAFALLSSPVLAGTMRDVAPAPQDMTMPMEGQMSMNAVESDVSLGATFADRSFDNRGDGGVNDRPYDKNGRFRF